MPSKKMSLPQNVWVVMVTGTNESVEFTGESPELGK